MTWYFTRPEHPAHSAAYALKLSVPPWGGLRVEISGRCDGDREQCARYAAEFDAQNKALMDASGQAFDAKLGAERVKTP